MKIGHFVSLFPSNREKIEVYGVGKATYYLCSQLAQKGHDVHIFAPFKKNLIEKSGNLTVHFHKSFLDLGRNYAYKYISYKMLFDPIKIDLDIVHVHNDTPLSVIAGLRYAKKKRKPLVVTWHGDWIENFGGILRRIAVYFANRFVIDKFLSYASAIIIPSYYYFQQSKFLKKFENKVIEIPNGINIKDFNVPYSKEEARRKLGLPYEKNIILFLSGLFTSKGPHILLKAIPKILENNKNCVFIFAGKGKISEYEKLSRELGVKDHVKFIGYVEENLKPLYYKAADIFVFPSIGDFEVFPIVLLEASASGLPMVVSNLSTLKCIVEDGYNGFFFTKGDEKSLADIVIYLLENKDIREKMGKNAKNKVMIYSWERISEETEKIYEKCIKKQL